MLTIQQAMRKLTAQYERKNADYGNSADETYRRFGDVSYLVRMSDKMNRWQRLKQNEARVKSESLADTMGDMFTYCCMAYVSRAAANAQTNASVPHVMRTVCDELTTPGKADVYRQYDPVDVWKAGPGIDSGTPEAYDCWLVRMAARSLVAYTDEINRMEEK